MTRAKPAAFSILLSCLLLPAVSFAAPSQEYSYLEMNYIDYDVVDGFSFIGSWELGPNGYIRAGYEELEDTSPFNDATVETLQFGGGLAFAIAPNTDIHVGAAFINQESGSFDESGYQLDAGIRGRLTNLVELYGDLRHRDLGDFDEDLVGAGVRFHLSPLVHVSAGFEDADNYDGYRIGARFTF